MGCSTLKTLWREILAVGSLVVRGQVSHPSLQWPYRARTYGCTFVQEQPGPSGRLALSQVQAYRRWQVRPVPFILMVAQSRGKNRVYEHVARPTLEMQS